MSEYIISDEGIEAERRQAYEAGKRNRNVWTAKAYHGEKIVRCRDCKHFDDETEHCYIDKDSGFIRVVASDGFCKWGKKEEQ